MVDQQQSILTNLFAQYVALRQNGKLMDDVVQIMQESAYQLPRAERHQLGKLVQDWEAENSAALKNARPVSAKAAEAQPGKLIRRIATPTTQTTPAAFGTRFLDSSKIAEAPAKQMDASIIRPLARPTGDQLACPHCQKPNKLGDPYCFACGHILESSETMTKPLDKADFKGKLGTAYFAQSDKLTLSIRGASGDIQVELRDELMMGRASAQGPLRPDIDLSKYNAEQQGVSRLHASFRRQDNTVVLVDLGSANKTFINGQRVYPHEVRVLRSGDEIRLGKMVMKVTFKRG